MGRTIVVNLSDGTALTFRKVQNIDPNFIATNGVNGPAASSMDDGFSTGYILLGINGAGPNTAVTGHDTYIVTLVAKYGV